MSDYAGFEKVKLTKPTKSTFDLSHDKRLTTRMGRLTPCLVMECVPSDYFSGSSEMLVRLAPLLAPIYDQIEVYCHFYFVPNRLLWKEWEKFITGGRLGVGGGDPPSVAPIPPYFDMETAMVDTGPAFQPSSLSDYLGVPILPMGGETPADYAGIHLDAMPHVAYALIYMEYYRDRNFVPDDLYGAAVGEEDAFPVASGELVPNQWFSLRRRSYKHDYFTSALPFTQRGTEVLIPLDGSVTYLQQSIIKRADTGTPLNNFDLLLGTQTAPSFPPGTMGVSNDLGATEQLAARVENIDSISNISTTINDFRSAYALQVWLERNAIGGSRYTESTQAHFGVRPQDSRLQRPEYIGGGRIPVKISEVIASSYSLNGVDEQVPLATMAGHGVTYGNTNQFRYFCTEHGFIMGILSIMNPPSYHQGMPKMFRRRSFLDYPWPTFAKLGEQQVDKAEIYGNFTNLTEDADGNLPLFGYQSRYADWKYICNWNHGQFHDTLLFWTLTRNFGSSPELGATFVEFGDGTQNAIFAVDGEADNFWLYIHNKVTVKRPLPYFGTPNTLGFV